MAGLALAQGRWDWGALVLTAFHCYLRPNEFLKVTEATVALPVGQAGVLSLPWTKIGQQRGARETVVVEDELTLFWLRKVIADRQRGQPLLEGNSYAFRKFFDRCISDLGLGGYGYKPYSLRRGGATHDFTLHQDLQRCLFRGRWGDIRTGRIYICDGAALLAEFHMTVDPKTRVAKAIASLRAVSKKAGFSRRR